MVNHKSMATSIMVHDDHIRVFTFCLVTVAVIRTTMAGVPEPLILADAVRILHHSLTRRGIVIKHSRGSWFLMFHPAYDGT